jgi:hypothetical protein
MSSTEQAGPCGSPLTEELGLVLAQMEDRTNQTWAGKRKRWAALVRAQDAEIQRLHAALARANENHERFERGWYLRGDALESIRKHCEPQPSALAAAIVATCDNGLKA